MLPENVAQERRRFGHEPFASHVAQVLSLPGVQWLVAARRRYHLVVRFVVGAVVDIVVIVVDVLHVLVHVTVVVAACRRLVPAVVVGAADTAAAATDAIANYLTAAAHDRGCGVRAGRGKLLKLRSAADDPAQQRRGRWLGYGELTVGPPEPVRGLRFRPKSRIYGKGREKQRTTIIN